MRYPPGMAGRLSLAIAVLVVTGCEGVLGGERDDASGSDGGMRDAPIAPGTDAPGADTPSATPDTGTSPACEGVSCGAGAVCDPATGDCNCAPGFVDTGGTCTAAPPGDPSTRSAADVCDAWTEGHRTTATASWTEGATMCDPGSMSRAALDDTLRRITMYRWLVGLPAVLDDAGRNTNDQACAIMMHRRGTIDHNPTPDWPCYTEAGRAGAGSSNLAYGTGSAADAIDLFITDAGVDSLGHRRWVLNDPLGVVGIGFAGSSTCLGVFDSSGAGDRPWTSVPNAGIAPLESIQDRFGRAILWSFHSRSMSLGGASVTMARASDGSPLAVTVSHPPDGYGPSTVAWAPDGWMPSAGQRYRVTVTAGSEVSYEVELTACE